MGNGDLFVSRGVNRDALERDGHNPEGFFNRGTAHFHLGNYAESVADLKQAMKADPHHRNAQHQLKVGFGSLGRIVSEPTLRGLGKRCLHASN